MNQGRSARRTGGLPSNPRVGVRPSPQPKLRRAPSVEKLATNDRDSSGSSGRSMRPQKSMPALIPAPDPSPRPSLPPRRRSVSRRQHTPTGSLSTSSCSPVSSASSSSSSSSTSSFFDKIKGASSRTSFDDDVDDNGLKMKPGWEAHEYDRRGDGPTVWSRVAAAAGSLTINVSRTWAVNIGTFTGEDTPPGQESRLTRSLRAYHLAKARDPTDLPSWLFEPSELSSLKGPGRDTPNSSLQASHSGLRDIYDAAPTAQPRYFKLVDDARPSKAADRLQAMRDAKRGITRNTDLRTDGIDSLGDGERRLPRIGLPSRPSNRS